MSLGRRNETDGGSSLQPPAFAASSELLRGAFEFAGSAHHGPARRGDTDIEHPVAVAGLLSDRGFDEPVVAAALLHDVIEDTTHPQAEIAQRFPAEVAELVRVMTEDPSIPDYAERKAEHRRRVLEAGLTPASVYLADKLARIRRYAELGKSVDPARLRHYRTTLTQFSAADSELPFLDEIARELPELRAAEG